MMRNLKLLLGAALILLVAGCPAEAQAAPRAVSTSVSTVTADSATVTVRWDPAPGSNFDGYMVTLTMSGAAPFPGRPVGLAAPRVVAFRVGAPATTGMACVAATRGTSAGKTKCAGVSITWPVAPIPEVPGVTTEVTVDTSVAVVVVQPPGAILGAYVPVESSTVAELPRTWINTTSPTPLRTVAVTCSTLQTALNAAADGDRLALPARAACVGNFTYRGRHPGAQPVILTTATPLPPEGTRVTPTSAQDFATLVTPNSAPALNLLPLSAGLRLSGITLQSGPSTRLTYALMALPVVRSVDSMATDITLDRVYMVGHDSLQLQRCFSANGVRVAVVDSWLAGCHWKGADAQAIIAWNSPGPFKIVNNHLEGSGENILFGGADPAITGLVASDIEIRRNEITKPLTWKDSTWVTAGGDTAYFNPWTEKLLVELKSANRVLIEDNIIENNWVDAQTGYAVWFKSANQSSKCPWCSTSNVIFRHNLLRNTVGGIAVTRGEAYNGGGFTPTHNIDIHDILMDSVGTSGTTGARRLLYFVGDMLDFSARNITSTGPGAYHAISLAGVFTGGRITDNLLTTGNYGIFCDGHGFGAAAISACFPTGTFTGNVFVGKAYSLSTMTVPAGNTYPGTLPYTGPAGVDVAKLMTRLTGVRVAP